MSFDNTVREDEKNPYCVYKLMHFYVKRHLPPDYTGKFFLQRASPKKILKRIRKGNPSQADVNKPFTEYSFNK